jgi:hypothetical protein
MDAQEFRKDFVEDIKAEATATGEGSCATFVSNMANYLINAEVLSDFTPSFYIGTGKNNKRYRIDGYVFDEFDSTMNLVIADYEELENRTLTRTVVNQLISKLAYFVDQAYNSQLYRQIEMSTPCSDLIDLLRLYKNRIRKYRFFIFSDAELSSQVLNVENVELDGIQAECQIWDIDRLFRVCCSNIGRQAIEIDFKEYSPHGIPCLETSDTTSAEYKSYLCVLPGSILADIYDRYGGLLLESNVRSFLSTKVTVNKKIRETILRCPSMFFAFNNGIAATAKAVIIEDSSAGRFIVGACDFQIINGGQTTASLSNARHKDGANLKEIFVQMKLTQIGEMDENRATEMVRNISRSSNSQSKVSDADFFATHPFHIRMEQFSRRLFAPAVQGAQYETKWFYERARGQYLQEQMRLSPAKKKQFILQQPREQVITKTDFAKVRNTWAGFPQWVSRGAQTNFMKFAELTDDVWLENDVRFNERYFQETVALTILFRYTERFVTRQAWYEQGYRANIVTYSLAYLHFRIAQQFKDKALDLMLICNKQEVPEPVSQALEKISEEVFRTITASDRPTINVTQWCKRDDCWRSVQAICVNLPASFDSVLADRVAIREAEKESRADQKLITGTEAQVSVLQYSAEQWRQVMLFAKEKRLVTPEEEIALGVACRIPERLPNSYQCQRLLVVLERVFSEGFSF